MDNSRGANQGPQEHLDRHGARRGCHWCRAPVWHRPALLSYQDRSACYLLQTLPQQAPAFMALVKIFKSFFNSHDIKLILVPAKSCSIQRMPSSSVFVTLQERATYCLTLLPSWMRTPRKRSGTLVAYMPFISAIHTTMVSNPYSMVSNP